MFALSQMFPFSTRIAVSMLRVYVQSSRMSWHNMHRKRRLSEEHKFEFSLCLLTFCKEIFSVSGETTERGCGPAIDGGRECTADGKFCVFTCNEFDSCNHAALTLCSVFLNCTIVVLILIAKSFTWQQKLTAKIARLFVANIWCYIMLWKSPLTL